MLEGPSELRLLVLLLLNAVPLVSAWRLARRIHGPDTLAALADTVLLHYLVQYLAVGAAGLLGVLSIGSLIVVVTLLALAIELLRRRLAPTDHVPELPAQLPSEDNDSPDARANDLPQPTPHRALALDRARWHLLPLSLAALWTLALVIALLEHGWITPPLANDSLIYHLPAAAQWLQTGSLSLYQPWFHNPTNAFSPLAGSMFLAWWIAPLGNDFVARYGQTPALALLLLSTARLARDLGARPTPAAMLALSAVLCRPVIGQTQLAKDDLFVAAFFMSTLSALTPAALRNRIGIVRLGVALALLLATKYTVAYALPILLPALDAPRQARTTRHHGRGSGTENGCCSGDGCDTGHGCCIGNKSCTGDGCCTGDGSDTGHGCCIGNKRCTGHGCCTGSKRCAGHGYRAYLLLIGIVLALAGPWYARNLLLTSNPLFPLRLQPFGVTLLEGPLRMTAEPTLLTVRGFISCVVESYYGTTVPLAVVLLVAWLTSVALIGRAVITDPLRRALLLGAPLSLVVFALTAPYAEARFVLPGVLALIVSPALLARRGCMPIPITILSAVMLLASAASSFIPQMLATLASTTVTTFAMLLVIAWVVHRGWSIARVRQGLLVSAVLLGAALTYVYWDAYLNGYRVKIEQDAVWAAPGYYEDLGRAWLWARRELPADATVAVANTPFAYPLMGFELKRSVVYVPTRVDINSMLELPRIENPLRGDEVVPAVAAILYQQADRATWLQRLKQVDADYLFIALDTTNRQDPGQDPKPLHARPPELELAESQPQRFQRVFANGGAVVYRVIEP